MVGAPRTHFLPPRRVADTFTLWDTFTPCPLEHTTAYNRLTTQAVGVDQSPDRHSHRNSLSNEGAALLQEQGGLETHWFAIKIKAWHDKSAEWLGTQVHHIRTRVR